MSMGAAIYGVLLAMTRIGMCAALIALVSTAIGAGIYDYHERKNNMDNLKEILFNAVLCERQIFEASSATNTIPEARTQLYRDRHNALWSVVEEAELVDEFQQWEEEHKHA